MHIFSRFGINSSDNVFLGPEPMDPLYLLAMNFPHFSVYDRLLHVKRMVGVVRREEADVYNMILTAVAYAKSLLIILLLMALVVAPLLWFIVSLKSFSLISLIDHCVKRKYR